MILAFHNCRLHAQYYSKQSFDARYFGVQNEAGITGTARPVWIFD
jgi:type IV secretory pathway protease TraF